MEVGFLPVFVAISPRYEANSVMLRENIERGMERFGIVPIAAVTQCGNF